MTAALLLVGFAAAIHVAAPALLHGADWADRAPRLGVAVWYASVLSVMLAVLLAAVVLAATPHHAWDTACILWRICVTALSGGHGLTGWLTVIAGLVLAGLALARLANTAQRVVPAALRWRRRHVAAVRMVGHAAPGSDVTVIDHSVPAAYIIAARPKPLVVVTSATINALTEAQLAAVIAHERAHAAGHHHILVGAVGLLSEAFPASQLFNQAHTEVSRLVEVCADDTATRRHCRIDLARALVAIAEAGATHTRTAGPTGATPTVTLAAAGGNPSSRLHRLLSPPTSPTRQLRLSVTAIAVALPVVPIALATAALWIPALTRCPSMLS